MGGTHVKASLGQRSQKTSLSQSAWRVMGDRGLTSGGSLEGCSGQRQDPLLSPDSLQELQGKQA